MAEGRPTTSWRQGHVLTAHTAKSLGLAHPDRPDDTVAVVISHCCDIAQPADVEQFIEVMVGCEIEKPDGNFRHAKSSRTLHLDFDESSGDSIVVELLASRKIQIPKTALDDQLPSATLTLSPRERNTLRRWLAARYQRAAFPDEFIARLQASGIVEGLKKIFAATETHLAAVYFDLDEGEEIERYDKSSYKLSIYLVHTVDPDPSVAAVAAESAQGKIEKLFEKALKKEPTLGLDYEGCYVLSMNEVTLSVADRLKKYNTDYLSIRSDPESKIVSE